MGLLSIPKTYTPRKGAPREKLAYISDAEDKMLLALTDGKADMTKHGIKSYWASGNSWGGMAGAGNTPGTTAAGGAGNQRNTNSGTSGTGGSTNPGRGGSAPGSNAPGGAQSGNGGSRDSGNTNRGNTGTGGPNNPGRGGSSPGGALGIGRDPAMGGNYGRGTLGMQQGGFNSPANQIARSVASAVNRAGPQYTGPARYSGAFNANRSQQAFGGYPNSMSGMMPGQLNGFASPNVNPMAPQASPSTFPARPGVIAQNNISTPPYVSAMKQARMSTFPARPGVIAANNQPEAAPQQFTSNLGYQAPAGAFSEAQFGMQSLPPNDIYRDPEKSAAALRSVVNGINLMGGSPEVKIDSMFRNMGYTNPLGRAAAIGRFGHETADFDPSVFSGQRLGDEGTAYGLAQWRHERQDAAKSYADQMGIARPDIAGQAAFAGTEMANSYPKAYGQLQNAKTIADAMLGMNRYESPKGQPAALKSGNPNLVSGYADSMARAQQFAGQTRPTQVAGMASPSAAPPSPQVSAPAQPDTSSFGWMDALKDKVKEGYGTFTEANQKINALGGGEKVQKLARTAQAIMDVLGGSGGRPSGRGGFGKGGNRDDSGGNGGSRNGTAPPPVTPPAPPVNPMTPWLYPQYQSQWAGLPTGIGGYARG